MSHQALLRERSRSFRAGEAAERSGHWEEALEHYRAYAEALTGSPDHRVAYACLSRTYDALGETDASLDARVRFIELTSEANRPALYKELGEELLLDDPQRALDLLKRAFSINPKIGVLQRILSLDPDYDVDAVKAAAAEREAQRQAGTERASEEA